MQSLSARLVSFVPLALLGFAAPSFAQSGPFQQGELIYSLNTSGSSQQAIYRMDPATGDGEPLVEEIYFNNAPGWFAYEPVRDRLLAYVGYFPQSWNPARLYAIAADGTVRSLGFDAQKLGSFAPTGDGRVYMNKDKALHMLTVDDQLVPVLDENGVPYDLSLDHLIYDGSTNSLIGASVLEPDSPCHDIWHFVVHRLPLTPDGTQLAGPDVCAGHDLGNFALTYVMGLDWLANGNILMPMSNVSGSNKKMFLELDPTTLGISIWSEGTIVNINGGAYVESLDRVYAVRDNQITDELRYFTKGQGGAGTLQSTDVPLGDNQTGEGPANQFGDIDGETCEGYAQSFGVGIDGTGGIAPKLHVGGCPRIGATFEFEVWDAVGGSGGLVLVSLASAPIPILGGTLHVLPPFVLQLPFATSGAVGAAGAGTAYLPQLVPSNPALVGLPIFTQALIADGGAPEGLTLSNAIELTVGQ